MTITSYVDLPFVSNYKRTVRHCVINRNVEVLLWYYVTVMKKSTGTAENHFNIYSRYIISWRFDVVAFILERACQGINL